MGAGHSYRVKGTTPGDIRGRLEDPSEASTPLSGLQGREPLTKEPSLTYTLGSLARQKTRGCKIKQTNKQTGFLVGSEQQGYRTVASLDSGLTAPIFRGGMSTVHGVPL